MPQLIYYRIAGNAVTFSTHVINGIVLLSALQNKALEKDPEIQVLASMQSRFITVWNVTFQLMYAALALTCDVLTVMNKDHLLPKQIKKFRDGVFSAVIVPGTLMIFTLFWPIYIYDRELIYPEFIDKVFSFKSNLVMHLAIVPFLLWELAFQPRTKPASHLQNVTIGVLFYLIFNAHIQLTYNERGIWPYPMINMMYGTIYYLYFHIVVFSVFLGSYYVQWPICAYLWGNDEAVSKKVN